VLTSVVVPTVAGREEHLARCLTAYRERSVNPIELIVIHDRPTVGIAWNEGAGKAVGDLLHFTADDLEPLARWDEMAVDSARAGRIPAPGSITRVDGTVDRSLTEGQAVSGYAADISVIPFCSREQWECIGSFLDCHYFTDSFFSHRAVQCGYPIVGRTGFAFVHHYAQPGRGAGMTEGERMAHDEAIYAEALRA
jgi:hypothetical protein